MRVRELRKLLENLEDSMFVVVPFSDHKFREVNGYVEKAVFPASGTTYEYYSSVTLEDGDEVKEVFILD